MEYSTDSVKPLVTEPSVPHTGIADLDPSMTYTYKSNGNYNALQGAVEQECAPRNPVIEISFLGQGRRNAKTSISRWINVCITRRRRCGLAYRWWQSTADSLAKRREDTHHGKCQEHEASMEA